MNPNYPSESFEEKNKKQILEKLVGFQTDLKIMQGSHDDARITKKLEEVERVMDNLNERYAHDQSGLADQMSLLISEVDELKKEFHYEEVI